MFAGMVIADVWWSAEKTAGHIHLKLSFNKEMTEDVVFRIMA